MEFRDDPDSQTKFLSMRDWMNEVARNKLYKIEIEQKAEYLIDQFETAHEAAQNENAAGDVPSCDRFGNRDY